MVKVYMVKYEKKYGPPQFVMITTKLDEAHKIFSKYAPSYKEKKCTGMTIMSADMDTLNPKLELVQLSGAME